MSLIFLSRYILFVLFLSIVPIYITQNVRIAYIFAGSIRSFLIPAVRKSIEVNLIKPLCPVGICNYDIFLRASLKDNKLKGYDANGLDIMYENVTFLTLNTSIEQFRPLKSSNNYMYVQYYETGSKEEIALMIYDSHGEIRNKIYRILDFRRYSMYYTRWKAYEMMLENEQILGYRYDWVIHARLDAAWGSPITPIYRFIAGKFYLPNTWVTELPDTFAIMSRNISKVYFDMDTLLTPYTYCIGGPNFNSSLLRASKLKEIGFSASEIRVIFREDCRIKFARSKKVVDSSTGIAWNIAGVSESIQSRRFEQYRFNVNNGGIKLIPLFMYIVRYPYEPLCYYLDKSFALGLSSNQTVPVSIPFYSSCMIFGSHLKKYSDIHSNVCEAKLDQTFMHLTRIEPSDESCLMKEENTDINFMPFRIRPKYNSKYCLTSPYTTNEFYLNMSTCINLKRMRDQRKEVYTEEQMFYFYPLITTPQKIIQHTTITNEQYCLTAKNFKGSISMDIIPVYLEHCSRHGDRKYPSAQMFTVDIINVVTLGSIPGDQNMRTLKPITNVVIKWMRPPLGRPDNIYCLTLEDYKGYVPTTTTTTTPIVVSNQSLVHIINLTQINNMTIDVMNDVNLTASVSIHWNQTTYTYGGVYLKKCNSKTRLKSVYVQNSLPSVIIERTRTVGKPFLQGLTLTPA